ncbi:MAG TPA: hypothetical protein VFK38_06840 [Candidatus Limnocylindrales bacterium]|nr:hypothetical protein [Candidatus Limnocylindrales bacterium]
MTRDPLTAAIAPEPPQPGPHQLLGAIRACRAMLAQSDHVDARRRRLRREERRNAAALAAYFGLPDIPPVLLEWLLAQD